MFKVCKVGFLAGAIMILGAASALAVPITYTYSGTGSGTIGTVPFTNAAFTITAQADTANIGPWCCGTFQNTHLNTTINIAGVGSFTITAASHTWIAEGCCGGIGANLSSNWITINEAALVSVGYGLATNIGPIVEPTPADVNQFANVSTTGGALTFTNMGPVTFQATTIVKIDCPVGGGGPDGCQAIPTTLLSRPGVSVQPRLFFTDARNCPANSFKVSIGAWQVCSNRQ